MSVANTLNSENGSATRCRAPRARCRASYRRLPLQVKSAGSSACRCSKVCAAQSGAPPPTWPGKHQLAQLGEHGRWTGAARHRPPAGPRARPAWQPDRPAEAHGIDQGLEQQGTPRWPACGHRRRWQPPRPLVLPQMGQQALQRSASRCGDRCADSGGMWGAGFTALAHGGQS